MKMLDLGGVAGMESVAEGKGRGMATVQSVRIYVWLAWTAPLGAHMNLGRGSNKVRTAPKPVARTNRIQFR